MIKNHKSILNLSLILVVFTFILMTAGEAFATWFHPDWSFRQKIVINSSQVPGDLSNFPVLVSATDANLKVKPAGNVGKSNGGDILFTLADGKTQLDHEIESYNSATGELTAWVEVPNVSSTSNTAIYMYYGNSGAADQWNVSGTWESNYRGVWHFSENPSGTPPQMQDSTSNNNHGTSGGGMTSGNQVAGQMNGSLNFDGINDDVIVPLSDSLKPDTEVTVSVWIKTPGGGNASGIVDTFRYGSRRGFLIETGDSATGDIYWSLGGDNAVAFVYFSGPLNDNEWHHIVGIFNGQNMRLYVDGVLEVTNNTPFVGPAFPSALQYPNVNLEIGGRQSTFFFSGLIDEVRISGTERSDDWIETSYNNQDDPSSFLSLGAQQVFTPAPTMTQWGMVIFMILAGIGAVFSLMRKRIES